MKTWILVALVIIFTSVPARAEIEYVSGFPQGTHVLSGEPERQLLSFVDEMKELIRQSGFSYELKIGVVGTTSQQTSRSVAEKRTGEVAKVLRKRLPQAEVSEHEPDNGLPENGVRLEYAFVPIKANSGSGLIVMIGISALVVLVLMWLFYPPRIEWLYVKGWYVMVYRRGKRWYSPFRKLKSGKLISSRSISGLQKFLGQALRDDSQYREQRDELEKSGKIIRDNPKERRHSHEKVSFYRSMFHRR